MPFGIDAGGAGRKGRDGNVFRGEFVGVLAEEIEAAVVEVFERREARRG
jgi:hypothetical protein